MQFKKILISHPKILFSILSILLFIILFLITSSNIFYLLNLKTFDVIHSNFNRIQFNKPLVSPLPKVLIINIDSKFIKSLQTYPIPRKYYGFLLHSLEQSNVLATGISVVFTETMDNSKLLTYLNKKVVTGYLVNNNEIIHSDNEIKDKTSIGFLDALLDSDGIMRKIEISKNISTVEKNNHFILELIKQGYPDLKRKEKNASFYIDFHDKIKNNITEISYLDYYQNYYLKDRIKDLENHFVIIGVCSSQISSYWNTSCNNYSSNYLLAAALLTILNNNYLIESSNKLGFILILVISALLFLFILHGFDDCSKKCLIKFLFLFIIICFAPLSLFYFFNINLHFFSTYFFIITFSVCLIIIKHIINIQLLNINLNNTNNILTNKINEINELNKIRMKAFEDISHLKGEIENYKNNIYHFANNISHQIKNPLTAVIMGTDYLKIRGNLIEDENINKQIDIISQSSRRMIDIINKIKILNILEQDNIFEKMKPISIHKFLLFIKDFANDNPLITDLNVKFKLEIDNTLDKDQIIFGDRELLVEMFDNIISNSIKYCGETKNCKIIIKIDKIETDKISIKIEDFGIGLLEGSEKTILSRFHREERITMEGSGIGLNIVNSIVKHHNGKLKIINKGLDKGIIIEIILPEK